MLVDLEFLCDEIIDCPHSTPQWQKCGFIVLRNYNLENNKINDTNLSFVTKEEYVNRTKRAAPTYQDIVFSREAPIGACAMIPENYTCCLGQRLVLLRANKTICNPLFLLYALQSDVVKKQIGIFENRGSTVSNLNIGDLKKLQVPYTMDIDKQSKIANILFDIDTQLERNNNIIKRLQVLAQTTYSRWFNQFEYPDNNKEMVFNNQLSKEIPTTFSVKSLGDIIVESKKSTVQVGEARLHNGNYPFFTSGVEILPYQDYFVDGAYCFLNTGGNADVKFYEGKSAYSTDTWCLSAKEYSYWLYLYLENIKLNMDQLFFSGSGLKHLKKDVFKKQIVCLPNKELIEQFNLIVSKLFKYQSKIIQENKELIALKEKMLPLLINGQLNI